MDRIKEATHLLNPGQTPVMLSDQLLFALSKHIQWQWPESYGEYKFVVMFGGLHDEMTTLKWIHKNKQFVVEQNRTEQYLYSKLWSNT